MTSLCLPRTWTGHISLFWWPGESFVCGRCWVYMGLLASISKPLKALRPVCRLPKRCRHLIGPISSMCWGGLRCMRVCWRGHWGDWVTESADRALYSWPSLQIYTDLVTDINASQTSSDLVTNTNGAQLHHTKLAFIDQNPHTNRVKTTIKIHFTLSNQHETWSYSVFSCLFVMSNTL